ncbi:hypothetical protein GGR56DRAFT_657714 [Xylariaceae sp. FL0804]|nr:hypothetical protein GGR56DRAFT_657714 [Xylariaceae sp. FL0804]
MKLLTGLVFITLLACSRPGATQAISPFNVDNFGGSKVAPWGLSYDQFSSLLSQPNATGRYDISGPDITAVAPVSKPGPVDGWYWEVSVKADIPINDTTYRDSSLPMDEYFTGAQVTLHAPSTADADVSWDMCVLNWQVDEDYSDELRKDDGSCSSVLSHSCIEGVKSAIAKSWSTSSGLSRCTCPDLRTIKSCGKKPPLTFSQACIDYFINSTGYNNPGPQYGNGTKPGSWSYDKRYLAMIYGGAPGTRGNSSLYNQTGSIAWPYMVVWGSQEFGSVPTSQLTCVRADSAEPGSVVPGVNGTSGANGGGPGAISGSGSSLAVWALAAGLAFWANFL